MKLDTTTTSSGKTSIEAVSHALKNNFTFAYSPSNDLLENSDIEVLQRTIQSCIIPSVNTPPAENGRHKQLDQARFPGTAVSYDDLQVTFVLDSEYHTYAELLRWAYSRNNPFGYTISDDSTESPVNVGINIYDTTDMDTIIARYEFKNIFPVVIGDVELGYNEEGQVPITLCTVVFHFSYMKLLIDGTEIAPI